MSVITEAVPVEGIDLDSTPPCEIITRIIPVLRCGKPSAMRIRSTCPVHGTLLLFVCAPCWELILYCGTNCTACGSPRSFGGHC